MKQSLFLAIIVMITSCASEQAKGYLNADIDAIFSKEFTKDSPGGCVLVKKGEETVFLKSYGLADLETEEKITENTILNLGSISKTFVANGILILQERGLLSIEDPIDKYFAGFKNKELAETVKIKHLLAHTSGLPDLRNVQDNVEFYITAKDQENFDPIMQADSLNFNPGAQFEYSNPAFNALALIIERTAGMPWQKFIEENIFKPAGMAKSKITDGPYPDEGVAHGYVFDDTTFVEYDYGEVPTFAASGNGGVWSSVMELIKYEKAIQDNAFLSEELTQESRTVFQSDNWKGEVIPFIGYSWFLDEFFLFGEKVFNVDMIYHTGSQGGFHSFFILIPEKDIHFIGLFNTPLSDRSIIIKEAITEMEKNDWLE